MASATHKMVSPELLRDQLEGINVAVILEIISALKGIRYGSVEVVIHNSKIVQIERREKIRVGQETAKGGVD